MRGTAVIVGSGPNGLAAAITLARAGLDVTVLEAADSIGGGTRTEERTLPGYLHDVCSAFHPLGVASPFFADLPLGEYGLEWATPQIQAAHPLDDETAAAAYLSLDRTATGLGADGAVWASDAGRLAQRWDQLARPLLSPLIRVPRRPLAMASFGLRAVMPATVYLQRRLSTPRGRALFAGMAAHAILPFNRPLTTSFGLLMGALCHVAGWPVAVGGSAAITVAMARYLEALGGTIVTGQRVTASTDLPASDIVLYDTAPATVASIYGDHLPARASRRLRRFRYGPAAFKLDLATSSPIPWAAAECRAAGTVHLGGTWEEIADAEAAVWEGQHHPAPFVIVGQQSIVDRTRAPEGGHTVWAYCHVPNGSTVDATDTILRQIERFAPGFRQTILEVASLSPAELEAHNSNYVGGDISGGAHNGLQLVARGGINPYRTGIDRVYLCSASTPPGAGVHGMCGWNAASAALTDLRSRA